MPGRSESSWIRPPPPGGRQDASENLPVTVSGTMSRTRDFFPLGRLLLGSQRIPDFIDSCFWHGCRLHCRRPKSHVEFWRTKIVRNCARDLRVTRSYRRQGWTVIRFWEHELNTDLSGCFERVMSAVGKNGMNRQHDIAKPSRRRTPARPSF